MKNLGTLAAFIGGAAVGAALGILFAPEKGTDTRAKIAEMLKEKGLSKEDIDEVIGKITSKFRKADVAD